MGDSLYLVPIQVGVGGGGGGILTICNFQAVKAMTTKFGEFS